MNSTRDGDRKRDDLARRSVDVNMINEKLFSVIKAVVYSSFGYYPSCREEKSTL